MAASLLPIRSILVFGAFWSLVHAEIASNLWKRAAPLSSRQQCVNPAWIPVCPGALPCIPPGGVCCSGGTYAMPPETCLDGTSPVATAIVSDVASATASSVTTPPPVLTAPVVEYTWYTWTITYYYYYYYYFSTDLTSSETTYYTTVSLTATDAAEASSLFTSLSASHSNHIPTQTVTPTYGSKPVASSTPAVTSRPSAPYPTGNATVPSSTSTVYFTGAAVSLRTRTVSYFGNIFVLATGVFMLVPGLLMLWL